MDEGREYIKKLLNETIPEFYDTEEEEVPNRIDSADSFIKNLPPDLEEVNMKLCFGSSGRGPYAYLEDKDGLTYKKEVWEALKAMLNLYYQSIPDREIDEFNKETKRFNHHINKSKEWKNSGTSGWVYILEGEESYKIGRSKDPWKRQNQIGIKLPFEVELIYTTYSLHHKELEKSLHERFNDKRLNGEWFDLEDEDIEFIKTVTSSRFDQKEKELISNFKPHD